MNNKTWYTAGAVIVFLLIAAFAISSVFRNSDEQLANDPSNAVVPSIDNIEESEVTPLPQNTDEPIVSDAAQEIEGERSFATLLTALRAAELTEVLESNGEYTIFAPTDAAFESLPDTVMEDLLQDEVLLREILEAHIIRGKVTSSSLSDGQAITAYSGDTWRIGVNNDAVSISDAMVLEADIEASNGVIHVIDTVLY